MLPKIHSKLNVILLICALLCLLHFAKSSGNFDEDASSNETQKAGKPTWKSKFMEANSLKTIIKRVGTNVRLRCIVDGDPEPRVKWYKNGNIIRNNNRTKSYKFFDDNQTILLKHLKRSDSGLYRCEATNIHGSISFTYKLRVAEKVRTAYIGEDVEMECDAPIRPYFYPNRRPTTFIWMHFSKSNFAFIWSRKKVLTLTNITKEHAGLYMCRERGGYGNYQATLLNVISREPRWAKENKMQKTVSASEGDFLELKCLIQNSSYPYNITWFKNAESIDGLDRDGGGYKTIMNGQILQFETLLPSDHARYSCWVNNDFGSISHTFDLIVEERESAKSDKPTEIVYVGQDVELECRVPNFRIFGFYVTWQHFSNGKLTDYKSSRIDADTRRPTRYLTLKNITEENAGQYICYIRNNWGFNFRTVWLKVLAEPTQNKSRSSVSINLEKTYRFFSPFSEKPRWSNENEMQGIVSGTEGNFLELSCLIQNSSFPYAVTWFKNGESIDGLDRTKGYQAIMNGQILQFETLFLSDQGMYTCLVRNTFGSINHTFDVIVEERLSPWWPSFITVVEGEDVRLKCDIYNENHHLFMWTKSNEKINGVSLPVVDSISTEYIEDVLLIRNASQKDSGKYTCISESNLLDLRHQSYWIRVVPGTLGYKVFNNDEVDE